MNIVFMGTPDFAVPSLKALIEGGHNVRAVFTQPDKPKGRGMKLTPSPVKEYALSQEIEVYQPQSLKRETETVTPLIKSLEPDCIVVVAYGKLLPSEILEIPRFGCVNVHGSLLPKYRGAAPIQWTVLNGDEYGGVTTMLMAEGMDTGDILMQNSVKVGETETSAELYDRLSYVGAELLVKTLSGLESGSVAPLPQNPDEATLAPMLSKEMSPTDFSATAKEVRSHINGLSDWPCATAVLGGKKLKLYRCEEVSQSGAHRAGEILDEKDFTVGCGKGSVRILEVQPEGSRRMSAKDYLLGHPLSKGAVLSAE